MVELQHESKPIGDDFILSWLTGVILAAPPEWPEGGNHTLEDRILQTAADHGVLALCAYRLSHITHERGTPSSLHIRLQNLTRQAAATELIREVEINRVLARLGRRNLQPLLLKGTPLAYTLYPEPHLRFRSDTDLLFADMDQAEQGWRIVQQMGYTRPNAITGKHITHEFSCMKRGPGKVAHNLDFHYRLSNCRPFARLFSFPELMDKAVAVSHLDEGRTLHPVHALVLACMHRLSHLPEGNENRLIWLYDLHLLACSFSPGDWEEFASQVRRKSICSLCLHGLQAVSDRFATPVPEKIINMLAENGRSESLRPEMWQSRRRINLLNYQSLDSRIDRLGFLLEHLFPAPAYMFTKYNATSPFLLPWLYLLRIIRGISKLFI